MACVMAQRPQRRCSQCSRPTRNKGGKCDGCKRIKTPISRERQEYEQTPARRANNRFTSSKRWRDFRRLMLAAEPRCVLCIRDTPRSVQPARQVHHVKPRETHPELTYDPSNVVGLCDKHHGTVEAAIRRGETIDIPEGEWCERRGVSVF